VTKLAVAVVRIIVLGKVMGARDREAAGEECIVTLELDSLYNY